MIFDFDQAESPAPMHAEVCILGAGAAGVALATELAERGKGVVVLEGGGPAQEQRSQAIYRSRVTAQPHRGIHDGRFRTLGGTTTRWGGQILELQPMDFAERDWVPGSGWPFAKSELTGYYEKALNFVGLRRVDRDDEHVWRELGLDGQEAKFARDTLGPELAMMYSRWLPERNVAELHQSTLHESRRIGVWLHASAVGFRMNAGRDHVEAVRVRGFSGRSAEVTADHFVVCLGGIESTRLLLQPHGDGSLPWQTNGLLGKHYQDHIGVNRIPVRLLRMGSAARFFGYNTTGGFRYHNKLWLMPDAQRNHATLNVAGTLGPDEPASSAARDEALNRLREIVRKRRRPTVGEALGLAPHVAGLAWGRAKDGVLGEDRYWKRVMLTVHSEQSPLGASAIRLGEERDELGLWRTELDWQISALELHTLRTYTRVAAETFAREGLATIDPPAGFFTDDAMLRAMCEDSFHHMGGTRMAASASDGVVDADLRLHGVANAFVCSASVFPTSGFSNPTHTVLALAMRLADKLSTSTLSSRPEAQSAAVERSAHFAESPTRLREIQLPNTRTTTQLGFGCAYLLGPGLDREKSRRLLDAAWDAGIRHFDAARLYGMGETEALLGEFLRTHPDATVTTKFGVLPPTPLQRHAMRAQRLVPALSRILPKRREKATFRAADAQRSLEESLRALERERVELFLLHEARAEDLDHDDLLDWLHRKRDEGVIGNFGFGGEYANIPALVATKPAYVPALQFERSLFSAEIDTGNAWCAYYRTFAPAARKLTAMFDDDPATLRIWSTATDTDLGEPSVMSTLLLRATLDAWPDSLQLFSTSSERHIFANVDAAVSSSLQEAAAQLGRLARATPQIR